MSIAEAEIGPWLRYQHVGCSGCEVEMEDIGIENLEDLKGLCDERSDLLDTFTQTVDEPKSKRIWEKLVLAWLWDVSVTSCKGNWVVGDGPPPVLKVTGSPDASGPALPGAAGTLRAGANIRVREAIVTDEGVVRLGTSEPRGGWVSANVGDKVLIRPAGR